MAEEKKQKIELVSTKIDAPQKPIQKQEQPEQQIKMGDVGGILSPFTQFANSLINTSNAPFLIKSVNQTTNKFKYEDYTSQLIFKPQQQTTQQQPQTTQQKSKSQWYPADISSFLHTAEVLKNRQILRLSQMGYKVKPTDEQYIYKKVLKSMAQKGLLPPTKQVDDRSLFITLYNNKMFEKFGTDKESGQIEISPKDLLDVKDLLKNGTPRDKMVFNSMKKYYENLANNLDKLIFDTPSQQVAYPFQIINFPMPQGQVIDVQK
jgi:hypothetical protein